MRERFIGRRGELDAAGFAAAAGVHLRLDHHLAAQALRDGARLLRRVGDIGVGHRDTVALEQLAGLILVQVHPFNPS